MSKASTSERPATWAKVIHPATETCEWIEKDGTRHPGTAAENAAVKAQLLEMRTISDHRRRLHGEERN